MVKNIKQTVELYLREKYLLVVYSLIGTAIFAELFYLTTSAESLPNNLAYAFVFGLPLCLGGDYVFKGKPLLKKLLPMFVAVLFGIGFVLSSTWSSLPLFQTHILVCSYLLFLLTPSAVRDEEKVGFHWVIYVLSSLGTAIIISLILFGLTAFLVWILKELFSIELIEYFKYLGLGLFSTFLPINIFALFAPKPETVTSLKYTMPRLLVQTMRFFFVPMIIIYVSVLLVYSLRILIKFELPIGMVSLPVSIAYGMYFLLNSYFESQGDKNEGLWKYHRWIEIAFAPLFITMGIGIAKRIFSYGFTVDRFYLVVGFFIIITSYILRFVFKRLELRKLILLAAIAFLITSLGPLNPVKVSIKSQSTRFIKIIKKYRNSYQNLADFKLSEWTQSDIDSASSALNLISNSQGIEVLKSLGIRNNIFLIKNEKGELGVNLDTDLRESLNNLSGNRSHYHGDENIKVKTDRVCKAFSVSNHDRLSIYNTRGFDILYSENVHGQGISVQNIRDKNILIKIDMKKGKLFVAKNGVDKEAIEFGAPVIDLVPKTDAGRTEQPLELIGEANGFRVKMLIEDIRFDCDQPSMDATILIKEL